MDQIIWLPNLVTLDSYSGDWFKYCEALYGFFSQDFKNENVIFRGLQIFLMIYPFEQGKEASFWHCISEGEIEEDRTIDLQRCKRIKWPRSIIDRDGIKEIKVWKNSRHGCQNYLLLVEDERYLVVLRFYKGQWRLWTTYLATYNNTLRKWLVEYTDYIKNNTAV